MPVSFQEPATKVDALVGEMMAESASREDYKQQDLDADVQAAVRAHAATKIQARVQGHQARQIRRKPVRQLTSGTALKRATNTDVDTCEQPRQFNLPGSKYFGFIKLANQPLEDRVFYPRRYLAASHEIFLYTLVICIVVTAIFNPQSLLQHPAIAIIGSINPCFGWDYPPSSYIAIALCSTNVYFTWRYTWLSRTRIKLRNPGQLSWHERLSFHSCVPLALSSNLWLLLWLIGPPDDEPGTDATHALPWKWHTGFFFFYAFSSWLACAGAYCESAYGKFCGTVTTTHRNFVVAYGLAFFNMLGVYYYDLIFYQKGEDPALPWFVSQISDLLWLACLGMVPSPKFSAPEPPMQQTNVLSSEFVVDTERRLLRQGTIRLASQFDLPNPCNFAIVDILNQPLHHHAVCTPTRQLEPRPSQRRAPGESRYSRSSGCWGRVQTRASTCGPSTSASG